MEFEKLGVSHNILKALTEMGFEEPTPIQEQALPLLLQGEDLIGQAQTGTGKTAAFGICMLERLLASTGKVDKHRPPVRALVLTPTRELAVQVTREIEKIGAHMPLKQLAVYGGQDIERQIKPLREGVDIVVGTPGRILDHIERGTLKLGFVEVVVLDEADRMLDMGFIDDIERILETVPKSRQTLLFSATMPKEIVLLSKRYMNHPQEIRVSEDKLSVENIRQQYIEVSKFDKLNALLALLVEAKPKLAIIFVRTKRGADRLNEILGDRGFHSLALHGDMSQNKRDRSMEAFRKKHINILVATDLASRGLDVTGVSHVINYDMPDDPFVYLHRIGRTGRMGEDGAALSLVFFDQTHLIGMIERATNSKMEKLEIEVKLELLPKRVRTSAPQTQHGRSDYRGGSGSRGGYGGRSQHGSSSGRRPGSSGRGGQRDSRRSHQASGSRRSRDSRGGHQYFGRRT